MKHARIIETKTDQLLMFISPKEDAFEIKMRTMVGGFNDWVYGEFPTYWEAMVSLEAYSIEQGTELLKHEHDYQNGVSSDGEHSGWSKEVENETEPPIKEISTSDLIAMIPPSEKNRPYVKEIIRRLETCREQQTSTHVTSDRISIPIEPCLKYVRQKKKVAQDSSIGKTLDVVFPRISTGCETEFTSYVLNTHMSDYLNSIPRSCVFGEMVSLEHSLDSRINTPFPTRSKVRIKYAKLEN